MLLQATLFCLFSLLCIVSGTRSTCSTSGKEPTCPNDGKAPSAASLIDNGLAALGGEEIIGNMTGVTYQSPSYSSLCAHSIHMINDGFVAIIAVSL